MYEPIESRVVIYPDAVKDVTEGGLHIPDMAQERPLEGTAMFVGPLAIQVRVRDRVLYTRFSGTEFILPSFDRPLLVMRESDILLTSHPERETLP